MARLSTRSGTSAHGATASRTDGHALTDPTLDLLLSGRVEIAGRLTDASNATFVCDVIDERGRTVRAVYKPRRGERPLDDFPSGTLARREVAAFLLSEATGWGIVPPTVLRDGPLGPGMMQLWVDSEPEVDVLELIVNDDRRLRAVCVFDVLANNADRKGGHLLPTADGHIYGVDHGICFAVEPKLRTVLWGWRGQKLDDAELAVVKRACDGIDSSLGEALAGLLSPAEVRATSLRAEALLRSGRFPQPDPGRPALPWPPF